MKLFLDVIQKTLSKSLNGGTLINPRFFQGDIIDLGITLLEGGNVVTGDILDPGLDLTVSIRSASLTAAPLAKSNGFVLFDGIAHVTLDLTGDDLTNYMNDFVAAPKTDAALFMEIETVKFDSTIRETLFLGGAVVQRDVQDSVQTGETQQFNDDFNDDYK